MQKSKNCIIYLAHTSEEDIIDFEKSLSLLYDNYLSFFPVDVIVFYEPAFYKYIPYFNYRFAGMINFRWEEVIFTIPHKYSPSLCSQIPALFPHPTHGTGPIAYNHQGFTLGYRHMCRFFAGEMYKQTILQDYEYYLRLDTDSFIESPYPRDLFEVMKTNNYLYGYIGKDIQQDNPKVIQGLWNFTNNYLLNNSIKSKKELFSEIKEGIIYYTNFELGKISWFLEKEYQNFYNALDDSGGIYVNRWGDAPIKYLGINLFMDDCYKWNVSDISYSH